MVCCFGRSHLFLPFCPDGRRHKLRDCAVHEQGATGSGVCAGWSWWKLRSCHCWVLLLPTHQRSAASFSSPRRLCHVLGVADPLLLLAPAWWHVPWPCSQDTGGIYGNCCLSSGWVKGFVCLPRLQNQFRSQFMIICKLFHAWSAEFAVAARMTVMHKACFPAQNDPLHGVQGIAGTSRRRCRW